MHQSIKLSLLGALVLGSSLGPSVHAGSKLSPGLEEEFDGETEVSTALSHAAEQHEAELDLDNLLCDFESKSRHKLLPKSKNWTLNQNSFGLLINELPNLGNIKSLSVAKNGLGKREIEQLAAALTWPEKLQKLTLSHNPIKDEGLKALGEKLKNASLEELSLAKTSLKDGQKLLQTLKSQTSLRKLNLGHNHLDDRFVSSFVSTKSMQSLESLALNHNPIGPKGARELAKKLPYIKLKELRLAHSNIGNEGATALLAKVERSNLEVLDLTGSFLHPIFPSVKKGFQNLKNKNGKSIRVIFSSKDYHK